MLEVKIEKMIHDKCVEHNFIPFHIEGKKGSEGVPDMVVISPAGNPIFFEVKQDKNSKVRPAQYLFLAKTEHSYIVYKDNKDLIVTTTLNKWVEKLDSFLGWFAEYE